MIKKIFFSLIVSLAVNGYAQPPHSFKYQAIIRDHDGGLVSEKDLHIRISILRGEVSGITVYSELHEVVSSKFGVVDLEIGKGQPGVGLFTLINWGDDKHFVKAEIDLGDGFETIGVSQLLSVPYSLFSVKSGDGFWQRESNHISYSAGNVGLGTPNPVVKLEINGNNELNLLNLRNENNSLGVNLFVSSNADFHGSALIGRRSRGTYLAPQQVLEGDRISGIYGSLYAGGAYQNSAAIHFYVGPNPGNGSYPSNIRFETTNTNQTLRLERMRIGENGNVGIGNSNPMFKLDVAGAINATSLLINGTPISSGPWTQQVNNISYNLGNVGIGTTTPVTKLEINGNNDLNLLNLRNQNNSLGINAYVSSDTDFHGSALVGRRSRGTYLAPQQVLEGDRISGIYGSLFANGDYQNSAAVHFYVGPNPGNSSYPSNIRFETTNTNQTVRLERMRITEAGNVNVKSGDIYLENINAGVIMKSPNGQCWRLTVDNSGNPIFTSITCP